MQENRPIPIPYHPNSHLTNSNNSNFFRVDVRSQNANSRKNRHSKLVDVELTARTSKHIDDPTPWFHFKGNDYTYICECKLEVQAHSRDREEVYQFELVAAIRIEVIVSVTAPHIFTQTS